MSPFSVLTLVHRRNGSIGEMATSSVQIWLSIKIARPRVKMTLMIVSSGTYKFAAAATNHPSVLRMGKERPFPYSNIL